MKTAKEVLADQMYVPPLREVPLLVYIELYFNRPQSHCRWTAQSVQEGTAPGRRAEVRDEDS